MSRQQDHRNRPRKSGPAGVERSVSGRNLVVGSQPLGPVHDDDDVEEIAPPGNRRSEPPTSGAPGEAQATGGDLSGRPGARQGGRGGPGRDRQRSGQQGGGQRVALGAGPARGQSTPAGTSASSPQSGGARARGVLADDDPFWQFGTPVELWGSTRASAARGPRGRGEGGSERKRYHECRTCGVKIEVRRSAQNRGKTPCPTCGRWMELR